MIPERIRVKGGKTMRVWKNEIEAQFRVILSSDPESFYFRMGSFSFKLLPEGKRAEDFFPPSHEYEF